MKNLGFFLVDRNESLLSDLQDKDTSGLIKTRVCDVISHDECLALVSNMQD